jgi:iron complex outermembrane receptor protein
MFDAKRNTLKSWIAIVSWGASLTSISGFAIAASVLQEVVVEAQKKVETITETPISIQSITGDQLIQYASLNLKDLAKTTAGLAIDSGVVTDIRMRGTSSVNGPVSLRTNIYLDGALVEFPRTIVDTQFDIQRFEVLKGPQGTLYGKSSPTGTINIRTQNPNLAKIDGYISGAIGDHGNRSTQFGISLPVIENELAVRLSGVYDENQTGQHNVTTDSDATNRTSSGRIVVLWEPSDVFSARAAYNYREKKSNPWYTIDGTQDGHVYKFAQDKVTANTPDRDFARSQISTLELNYSLNDHMTLTSVSGYADEYYTNLQDTDGSASLRGPGQINQLANGNTSFTIIPTRSFQEDLRLASDDNDFWDWQVGGYYRNSSTVTPATVFSFSPASGATANINTAVVANNEEFAGYTHNTFKLTDNSNLIVGARYQTYRANDEMPTTGYLIDSTTGARLLDLVQLGAIRGAGISEDLAHFNAHHWTGTVKLQHFFTPDINGYVAYDYAYRTGAPNLNLQGNLPNDFAVIKPETAANIELGLKSTFWDQRGRFSAALYRQVYKNFQQDILNVPVYEAFSGNRASGTESSNASAFIVNAKEVEIRGLETEINLLIIDGWDIGVSAAYTNAKFEDFKNNPCAEQGSQSAIGVNHQYFACDLSGKTLPMSPKWSGVFTSNFSMPAFTGMEWYFNALINIKSNQVDKLTRTTLSGYGTTDLFTGLRAGDNGEWDVSLWVKNVFDRRVVTNIFNSTEYNPGLKDLFARGDNFDMVVTNPPRQFGVTGTYRF